MGQGRGGEEGVVEGVVSAAETDILILMLKYPNCNPVGFLQIVNIVHLLNLKTELSLEKFKNLQH